MIIKLNPSIGSFNYSLRNRKCTSNRVMIHILSLRFSMGIFA